MVPQNDFHDERLAKYGNAIWTASRNDEGTISATGANIVARAVIAVADDEMAALRDELALCKRGGKTLGEILDRSLRDVLYASGMHHVIDETGDGDWALVWERLLELKPRADAAEAQVDELRAENEALRSDFGRWIEEHS